MAGGSGTRLWPLSRKAFPKQFLSLTSSDETMLQSTISRVAGAKAQTHTLICNEEHRFIAAQQQQNAGVSGEIILEPVGRNTAPAIALAALRATENGENPVMLVLAADHVIEDNAAFIEAINTAKKAADAGKMVTFGVVPTAAETGYGYIKRGAAATESGTYAVDQFVEKPSRTVAESYVDSGEYYWNSGMFMFQASRYVEELGKYRPDILEACTRANAGSEIDRDFVRVDSDLFAACPDESIDYAVMEKTDSAVVVPLDAGWSDVGSWSSLWDVSEKTADGNCFIGDVVGLETSNSFVHAGNRLVATIGLSDIIAVDTPDAVLIAHKDRVQEVKKVVEQLKLNDRPEASMNREVYRPWGKYDSIDSGERYQVKRITVNPGAKLSVQMHHHRAEHWIVVSGTAKVTNGDKDLLLTENQSTYIPVGVIHALENPGKVPLEMIEVQSGSYLGEDDIVRFEDRYGRA
jgi:mannose-1-phosphate guanylyltransferase